MGLSDPAKIQVIFARIEATKGEVFADIATGDVTATTIADWVERAGVVCWTQSITLEPPDHRQPLAGEMVHIVFEGGYPQSHPIVDWEYVPSAELVGAFRESGQASEYANRLVAAQGSMGLGVHVWHIPVGWYDERLLPDRRKRSARDFRGH